MTPHRAALPALVLLLACTVLLPQAVLAQGGTAAAVRIGYVDMKRLLDHAPQVIQSRQRLEREFAARDQALKAEESRLAALRERQRSEPAEALQREIDAVERAVRRSRETLRGELKARSDQELDESWQHINDAVAEFAREQGYDLILPSPVVYASPRVDVTERILERLRRDAPAGRTP